ncbi:MAG: hypothetical protein LBL41_04940 [Bifidobacteriaceae bacterium]|nr:hypothetical protein [Bifidobacteriaceae bacterium]
MDKFVEAVVCIKDKTGMPDDIGSTISGSLGDASISGSMSNVQIQGEAHNESWTGWNVDWKFSYFAGTTDYSIMITLANFELEPKFFIFF